MVVVVVSYFVGIGSSIADAAISDRRTINSSGDSASHWHTYHSVGYLDLVRVLLPTLVLLSVGLLDSFQNCSLLPHIQAARRTLLYGSQDSVDRRRSGASGLRE